VAVGADNNISRNLFANDPAFQDFQKLQADMNRIFEDYVAYKMKKQYPNLLIKTQHSSEHLLTMPRKQFSLRPDLMLNDNAIGDTKWKLVDSNKRNYGLSQNDLYQIGDHASG
jgi:5-methylcytosine-specific restriction enzyme subunit McrC